MISPVFCKILVEVAYSGNITAAAEKMNYSQGALSHAIKRTEEEIGFKIFKRSKYGVTVTAEGMALVPLAKKIVEYSEKFDETVASLQGLDYGHIKIGTYATMSMQFLPEVLKRFTEAYPGIQVELIEGSANEISTWLNEQLIDIALTSIKKSDTFEKIYLFDEALWALFPPDIVPPLNSDNTFNIIDFKGYNFITPMMDKRIDPDMLPAIEAIPSHMRMHVSSCDFISIMCLIRSRLGVSLLPSLVTSDYRDKLHTYYTEPQFYRSLGLGVRSLDESSMAAKKFIEYIKAYTENIFIPSNKENGIRIHI